MRFTAIALFAAMASGQTPYKPGSPLAALPNNVEIVTHFGERADFSPANGEIAFMNKSFGDAFVVDLKTRAIRCLTCNVPGAAFLRVMHFTSGDYLLIGPERYEDVRTSRHRDNELWFLSSKPGSKPVKLGQKMSEGAAISKRSLKIAFSETSGQNSELKPGASRLIVAELEITPSGAALKNKCVVFESPSRACTIEAQDFYDNDRRLTYSCYEPEGKASVWTIDLTTGEKRNESLAVGHYNEVEGIFPDGKHTCVESDRQSILAGREGRFRNIDIWKLKLGGSGESFERLTYFNDYEGWKASNPVISADGKMMAFQVAKSADEAGVGYGILLYHFK